MESPPAHFRQILSAALSTHAWRDGRMARLPGVQPLSLDNWLLRDEVFAAQMAYRDWLLEHRREVVLHSCPQADDAARELLGMIVENCGYPGRGSVLNRPDGVKIDMSADHPLAICGRLTQEDWCLLQGCEADTADINERHFTSQRVHKLIGGVLCFPSSWRLSDKIGRSLISIHAPVAEFDEKINSSAERMLGAIRAEQPLWRANFLIYTDSDLHQPRGEGIPKPIDPIAPRFVRVERQSFRRLPQTGAVAFGIHSSLIKASSLSHETHAALGILKPDLLVTKS